MKGIQSYLDLIREDSEAGWIAVYTDVFTGQKPYDIVRLMAGVSHYGTMAMLEAMLATADKKLATAESNMQYMLAVARQLWRDEMSEQLDKSRDEIRAERARQAVSDENRRLSDLMEKAKRRLDAIDTL